MVRKSFSQADRGFWHSPLIIVPSWNKNYRKNIGFRTVNQQIISEIYPLQNARVCLAGMENAKYLQHYIFGMNFLN